MCLARFRGQWRGRRHPVLTGVRDGAYDVDAGSTWSRVHSGEVFAAVRKSG